MKKKLGVLLYDDVQSMDFIGLWEVFSLWKTSLNAPLDLYLVAENGGEVRCLNEITVKAHCDFNNSPAFDYFFVPGGPGRQKEVNNKNLITFIQEQGTNAEYLLSVCTGMFLLHKAGLLHHQQVTTYWRALDEARALGDIEIVEERIVNQGKLWVAGGISSSIDLAFAFIAKIAGEETAGNLQLLFEYFPTEKVYAKSAYVDKLPRYYTAKKGEVSKLPKYIREYLTEHNNKEEK